MSRPLNLSRRQPRWLRLALGALWALLSVALLGAPAAAANLKLDLASLYRTDLRALGMGNAYGPIARGEGALLYNPAGLVQYEFDVKLDVAAAAEGEAGDFANDTLDLVSGSPSPTDVQKYLTTYLGTEQNYRAQTFYNVVANLATFNVGAGVGVMNQVRYAFAFDDDGTSPGTFDTDDHLRLAEQNLDIQFVSFAFQVFEGKLLMGLTLKNFTYESKSASASFQEVILSTNIELTTTGGSYDGSGYDLGFLYRVDNFLGSSTLAAILRPQLSLVANNVGGITLQKAGFDTIEVPASYDVGISLAPGLPWSPVHLLLSVQADDVTGALPVSELTSTGPNDYTDHDRATGQRMHYGAELGFWQTATGNHILNVRAGFNRGLSTLGYEINLFSGLRILYTRYQDDFGWDGAREKHTFQAAQISLGFAF